MTRQIPHRKNGAAMYHGPHGTQDLPPRVQSSANSSRWLVVAVAFCGALAGGSIVEAIAAFASRASMLVSPDHLIAEPLVLAGALSGGLLAAILASRDYGNGQRADPMIAQSLAATEAIPSEPMVWQPAPLLFPIAETLTSNSVPPARSKRRVHRNHRRARLGIYRYHPGRIASRGRRT